MTHILIPIKDIEDVLIMYQRIIGETGRAKAGGDNSETNRNAFMKATGKYYGIKSLLEVGKQISLDERDIEEKAKKCGDNWEEPSSDHITYGYKQALKDLL